MEDELNTIKNRLDGYKLLDEIQNKIDEFNQNREMQDVPVKAHLVLGYVNTGHIAKVSHEELNYQIETLTKIYETAKKA